MPRENPGILAVDRHAHRCSGSPATGSRQTRVGDYHLTGDTVELNPDGSISFVGRSDDIITSSGYRIGPYDVESALIEHPAVAEAAVVGRPDPQRTELVKAFVVLRPEFGPRRRWPRSCKVWSRRGWRRMPIRARSSSSPSSRKLPAAKSSASSCATRKPRNLAASNPA